MLLILIITFSPDGEFFLVRRKLILVSLALNYWRNLKGLSTCSTSFIVFHSFYMRSLLYKNIETIEAEIGEILRMC